jgi:phosphocarrier protein HPr
MTAKTHPTATRQVTIANELGLHARPAAEFAKQARRFRAQIFLIKGSQRFSAASLIDILRANLDQGASVTIEATGPDAEEAIEHLAQVVRDFKD